MEESGLGLI